MIALIPTLVVFLLTLILLFPEAFQDLMMAQIPTQMRPDPNRCGMRMVPAVAIFVFGFAVFQGWDHLLKVQTPQFLILPHIYLGRAAGDSSLCWACWYVSWSRDSRKGLVKDCPPNGTDLVLALFELLSWPRDY
jgi:hypothetical protein